jgi:hypothetical protein
MAEEQDDPSDEEQIAQIENSLGEFRNKFDTDLIFEALQREYFRYRQYMSAHHYEEGTILEMERDAKKSAEETDDEVIQQMLKNDRGGSYSATEDMK